MSSSPFNESAGSTSVDRLLESESSGSSDVEVVVHRDVVNPVAEEIAESDLPHRGGYDWVSPEVTRYFSRYRWSSSVETFVTATPVLSASVKEGDIRAVRASAIDNVCHGREAQDGDFFFVYCCMFNDSFVPMPFDEFTMGVLRLLNVAPTQLHPNAWASLQAFRALTEVFRLNPSPKVFLSYYTTHPASPCKWVSLVSKPGEVLFTPFNSSYKYFKDAFFKICIEQPGRHFFFDGETPKFPLVWTRNPTVLKAEGRVSLSEDDRKMYSILDQLPRKLPVRQVLSCLVLPNPARVFQGK